MKIKNILFTGGIVGLIGYLYYKAAQNLTIKFNNVSYDAIDSDNLTLTLRVSIENISNFTLAAPVFNINLYSDQTYIGTAINETIQAIPPGVSYLDLAAKIPVVSGVSLVSKLIINYFSGAQVQLPSNINYTGNIDLWFANIPIQGNLT